MILSKGDILKFTQTVLTIVDYEEDGNLFKLTYFDDVRSDHYESSPLDDVNGYSGYRPVIPFYIPAKISPWFVTDRKEGESMIMTSLSTVGLTPVFLGSFLDWSWDYSKTTMSSIYKKEWGNSYYFLIHLIDCICVIHCSFFLLED